MNSGIYIIVSPSNRGYIGSTKNFEMRRRTHFSELRNGKHHCDGLQNAWNKYFDELRFIVLEYCPIEKLIEREQWWMDNHHAFYGRMYNSSKIAGRPEHTPEVRAKISAATKGRRQTPEHIAKVRVASIGRKHSDETKAIMSVHSSKPERYAAMVEASKTRQRSPAELEHLKGLNKGRVRSDQVKAKMSAAQLRRFAERPVTEETKLKLREPRGPRGEQALANLRAGAIKRRETARAQKVREHMARLDWIVGVSL